jgi:hypothetical protein
MWHIELAGDQTDIDELRALAPPLQVEITTDSDGRESLGGSKFDDLSSAETVKQKAIGILKLLNGIARVTAHQCRPVQFGEVFWTRPGGTKGFFAEPPLLGGQGICSSISLAAKPPSSNQPRKQKSS